MEPPRIIPGKWQVILLMNGFNLVDHTHVKFMEELECIELAEWLDLPKDKLSKSKNNNKAVQQKLKAKMTAPPSMTMMMTIMASRKVVSFAPHHDTTQTTEALCTKHIYNIRTSRRPFY